MGKNNILVVDDDKNICRLLELYLSSEGYKVIVSHDGSDGLKVLEENEIDLVLLDVMLPLINGIEVCKLIKRDYKIPVILITARDVLEDKLTGFDAGADDYIVKPFEPKEVIARVKARLKDEKPKTEDTKDVLCIENLTIDINKYEVTVDGRKVDLKPKEIQLLNFLVLNKNIVFSRDQLLDKVWEYSFGGDTRTVDVHIKRIREKLAGLSPNIEIVTIWGVGYKFETLTTEKDCKKG